MRRVLTCPRALAINPDILLMDEALALDPLIRTEMQDELVKLQAKHQRTIVFISHDLMRLCGYIVIAIAQNGEVVQVGTPDEILNNPAMIMSARSSVAWILVRSFGRQKIAARRSPSANFVKRRFGPRSALEIITG